MRNICFYFQIHQPFRLRRYRFFEIGNDHYYYDDFQTEEKIRNLAEISYLKANLTILEMIRNSGGAFKCAFSISGIALEQLEQYAPEVIDSFKELAKTGCVEFLTEPYAHSLASVYDINEFEKQLKMHAQRIESLFEKKPVAFRNAELIYSNEIGEAVYKLGYKTILIDETKHVLGWKSPNYIYHHSTISKLKLLVRNHKLSDDISFRFSQVNWQEYPLTADKFIDWVDQMPKEEHIVNVWMGYEAFGHYQPEYSGIFEFMKAIPGIAAEREISFVTPTEATKKIESAGPLDVPYPISWSGNEKDISPWTGNDLQQEALSKLYAVGERVRLCKDKRLQRDWLILQSSDHFRYMSHKDAFNTHYDNAYDAFMNYMNVLADFLERVKAQYPSAIENEELNELLKTINNQEKEIEKLEEENKKLKRRKTKVESK